MRGLGYYALKRVLATVPVLIGISLITFFSLRLIPGGPAAGILGANYTAKAAASINRQLGLDRPLVHQLLSWANGLLHGNLGSSTLSGQAVSAEIASHFGYTAELTAFSLFLSLLVAIPFGVIAGRRQGGVVDGLARMGSVVGISVPSFVIAVVLILIFSVQLRVLPTGGAPPQGSSVLEYLRYLVMPGVALSVGTLALTLKMTRSSFLETSSADHVRTARSKGLRDRGVVVGHILRNALLPVVTVVGIQIGYLLGGAVIIEQVFSWPGMGSLLINSITSRDYPTVEGTVLFFAFVFVLVNLVTDLLLLVLDPRLRHA